MCGCAQDAALGVTNRTGGETGCADVIGDVAALAADVSRAVAVQPMTPEVADSAAAVAASAAKRKRRMPDSPRDTEVLLSLAHTVVRSLLRILARAGRGQCNH